jgi:hypothetical protein
VNAKDQPDRDPQAAESIDPRHAKLPERVDHANLQENSQPDENLQIDLAAADDLRGRDRFLRSVKSIGDDRQEVTDQPDAYPEIGTLEPERIHLPAIAANPQAQPAEDRGRHQQPDHDRE